MEGKQQAKWLERYADEGKTKLIERSWHESSYGHDDMTASSELRFTGAPVTDLENWTVVRESPVTLHEGCYLVYVTVEEK